MDSLRCLKYLCSCILLTVPPAAAQPGGCFSTSSGYIPPAEVGVTCDRSMPVAPTPGEMMERLREERERRAVQPALLPKEAAISYRAMTHEVPKSAHKAFRQAEKARAGGRHEAAITAYQKALEIDPGYLAAWNNLGSVYSRTGDVAAAERAFARAYELEPDATVASNLAFVHLRQGRAPVAETMAREALRRNPLSAIPRYLLGLALASQHKAEGEAIRLLEEASAEIPRAHFALGPLLAGSNRLPEAARHLRVYLASEGAADTAVVKQWLQEIDAEMKKR